LTLTWRLSEVVGDGDGDVEGSNEWPTASRMLSFQRLDI
jgi:hypothetical protein